jgi:hypothetical protein
MISAGREATMKRAIWMAMPLFLLVYGSSWSQAPLAVTPYYLVIDSTITTEDAGDWAAAAAMTARAHGEHPQGNVFATYRLLTGGPDEKIRVFFPLEKMADLDGWISNRQILYETVGKDRGQLALDDLELTRKSSERIVSFSEKLSRPRQLTGAPKLLWVAEVEVEEGRMAEYAALAARVKKAHDQSNAGQNWRVFGDAIGGNGSRLTYYYSFDEFASLDEWPSQMEVLTETYGEKEAARLAAAIDSLAKTRTSLWTLEPDLSQVEGKE